MFFFFLYIKSEHPISLEWTGADRFHYIIVNIRGGSNYGGKLKRNKSEIWFGNHILSRILHFIFCLNKCFQERAMQASDNGIMNHDYIFCQFVNQAV